MEVFEVVISVIVASCFLLISGIVQWRRQRRLFDDAKETLLKRIEKLEQHQTKLEDALKIKQDKIL